MAISHNTTYAIGSAWQTDIKTDRTIESPVDTQSTATVQEHCVTATQSGASDRCVAAHTNYTDCRAVEVQNG